MKQAEIKRTDAEDMREMVATKQVKIKRTDAEDIRKMAAAEGADAKALRLSSSC